MTSSVTVTAHPGTTTEGNVTKKLALKVSVFDRTGENCLVLVEQHFLRQNDSMVFYVYPPRMIQVEEVPVED